MKIQKYVRVASLVMLLVSLIPINQSAHAGSVDELEMQIIDHNFPGLQDILPDQPTVSTVINPSSVNIGEAARVTVSLNNVPIEGYTSAEITCTYDPNLVEATNIVVASLFGVDPATAINGPQGGRFIVAIAGSYGNKATNSGTVIVFYVRGLQAGQTTVRCTARVPEGNDELINIEAIPASATVLGDPLTPTLPPAPCDKAEFIRDINVPPGTVMAPGTTFIKTWRLTNIGSCTWTTSYQLVFFSGELMGAPAQVSLNVNVAAGQTVDISLTMTAPSAPGRYRGYWMFKNANGALFGVGPNANEPWFVDIVVSGATPTPTIPPTPCDKAEFVADISVPPGTVMFPGTQFTKTWRLKNVGTCAWTTSYRTAFFSGEQMGALSSIQLPGNVAPGATVDISLNMTAPSMTGAYRGYWIFQNATGASFGIGSLGNESWFVDIVVSNTTVTPGPTYTQSPAPFTPTATQTPAAPTVTPIAGVAFDFVASMCAATWTSGAGQLPCPGIDGNANGFVFRVDNPKLETGATDMRPSLLTFPQNVQNGYIQGFYPPIHIQNGDRFRSTLTCEFGATNCYVAFRLDYQVGSDSIKTFWGPFLERYEGHYYSADIDLGPLAGKDVRFILTLLSAGIPTGDRALWVGPIIYRPGGSSNTPVPTDTPGPFPTTDVSTYQNTKYNFKFTLPTGATIGSQTDNDGRVNLPFAPGTNLLEKYLIVNVSENANPCISPAVGGSTASTENVIINNIQFTRQTGQGAALSNFYDWVAYSTVRNNACISLAFILHSTNPGTHATPPPLFDLNAESAVFTQIISTFTWLGLPTATPSLTSTPVFTLTPFNSPTSDPQVFGILTGQVLAGKQVNISLFDTNHRLVISVDANSDGTYSITAPAGGTYTVIATASGHLNAQGHATVTTNTTTTMPNISLLPGDLDGNDVIDQFDALTIGMNYNTSTPAAADLNNDGIINVLDLELLAHNYRSTGPTVWQ